MTCPHDLAARETACADGMCPLCLAADLRRARAEVERLSMALEWIERQTPDGIALVARALAAASQRTQDRRFDPLVHPAAATVADLLLAMREMNAGNLRAGAPSASTSCRSSARP